MRDRLASGKSQRASRLGHGRPSQGHLARSGRPSLVTAAIFARGMGCDRLPSLALPFRSNAAPARTSMSGRSQRCEVPLALRSLLAPEHGIRAGNLSPRSRGRPPGGHTVFGYFLPRQKVTRAGRVATYGSAIAMRRGIREQIGSQQDSVMPRTSEHEGLKETWCRTHTLPANQRHFPIRNRALVACAASPSASAIAAATGASLAAPRGLQATMLERFWNS